MSTRTSGRTGVPPSTTTASTVQRFAARARAARRRSRRAGLLASAVTVLLAALAVFAWTGPLLVVRHVDVHGVSGDRAQQVRAAALPAIGRPLLRVDASAVESRVRRLPFVAAVDVGRGWPRRLVVTVDARTPRAGVAVAGGGYRLVDGHGVPYADAQKVPRGLPVIHLTDAAPERPTLVAAVAVLEQLPQPLGAKVTAVKASSPDAVTLTIAKKTVVWGSAADTERKARIFEALRSTKAQVYDVSSPDTPVLR
jgi:cell division protein FtsQ